MSRFVRLAVHYYLVVPAGVLIAMAWANIRAESYFQFTHALSFAVNDLGMALFFALVTQEIVEAMIPGGALHGWRRATLPIAAAAGGILVSVVIYLGYLRYVDEVMLWQAWPTAGAIDLAVSYFLARAIFRNRAVIAFTLLLAITSDIVVLPFATLGSPLAHARVAGVMLIAAGLSAALVLRRLRVRAPWPYLVPCGAVCWWGFAWSGLHPALALIPIVPFVPHSPRNLNLFADAPSGAHHSVTHLEHLLTYPVQVALFFFALVNGGVELHYFEPGTWALPLAALVGRPIGVIAAVGLASGTGFRVPMRGGWRELLVIGLTVSTGFTFALFLATTIFPIGSLLTQTRMGALSTVVGSLLAFAAARLLRVGRFQRADAK
jgi:NhaA family Na+:H+ antiporter